MADGSKRDPASFAVETAVVDVAVMCVYYRMGKSNESRRTMIIDCGLFADQRQNFGGFCFFGLRRLDAAFKVRTERSRVAADWRCCSLAGLAASHRCLSFRFR